MKYELGQLVFYLNNNAIHSASVLTRMCVENLHDDWDSTADQIENFLNHGKSRVLYITCHGEFRETQVFKDKESLVASLLDN